MEMAARKNGSRQIRMKVIRRICMAKDVTIEIPYRIARATTNPP